MPKVSKYVLAAFRATGILVTLALWAGSAVYPSEPEGSLDLTITHIRNDKGLVLVSLFNQPKGFPSDTTMVYRTFILEAASPTMNLRIDKLSPGEYAIAIVHDENQNLELDTNLVGAPLEGYAASGSNKRFSAPRFESSKFMVGRNKVELEIKMNYLF